MGEKQEAGGQVRQNNNGFYVFFIYFYFFGSGSFQPSVQKVR